MASSSGDQFFYLDLDTVNVLRGAVEAEFTVTEIYSEFGAPTFVIDPHTPTKEPFKRLVEKMKPLGLLPSLRRVEGKRLIRVQPRPKPSRKRPYLHLILFAATIATVFVSGYFNSSPLMDLGFFPGNIHVQATFFTIALLGIVGIHEFGHKAASWREGIDASFPIFIPGIPPVGTFGAVIVQKEPPVNRDQLFDLGFSGPLAGFVVAVIVAVLAISTSLVLPDIALRELEETGSFVPSPLIFSLLVVLINPPPVNYSLLTPPFGFAAWVGFVITFLNLLPVWQLDGGHISRALFKETGHKVASFIGLAVAFLTGFWLFALMLLFLGFQSRGGGPLDDVSPISNSKKILGICAYIIMGLSAVVIFQGF